MLTGFDTNDNGEIEPSWLQDEIDFLHIDAKNDWVTDDPSIEEMVLKAYQAVCQEGMDFNVNKFVEDNMVDDVRYLLPWASNVRRTIWFDEIDYTVDLSRIEGDPLQALLEDKYRTFLSCVATGVFNAWKDNQPDKEK